MGALLGGRQALLMPGTPVVGRVAREGPAPSGAESALLRAGCVACAK